MGLRTRSCIMSETQIYISEATKRNWEKLQQDQKDRLTRRANKSLSQKTILPKGYVLAKSLPRFVNELKTSHYPIKELIFSLCALKIEHNKVSEANKKRFFEEYANYQRIDIEVPRQILKNRQDDWIGFVYQSLTTEGQRILTGLYYTNPIIVEEMLDDIQINENQCFLDPCCGSGIFLLQVKCSNPKRLFGIDNDPIAVMIAKTNLMVKFNNSDVYPQIYQLDFLLHAKSALDGLQFDFIVTNPPWGSEKQKKHGSTCIQSNEQSTLFFTESYKFLNNNGILCFLFPSSVLKIKAHADFRRFVTQETILDTFKHYHERFHGVFTDFISLKVRKGKVHDKQTYWVKTDKNKVFKKEMFPSDSDSCVIPMLDDCTEAILSKTERLHYDDLSHSRWALGIITGNNSKVFKNRPSKGLEEIYTGKDIDKYYLKKASHFVKYDRSDFQQCAKDEFYRAKEKLVYKFVSNRLCFTYDDQQRLFLNSANILIPEVNGMSVKTVLAFLNSELFNFFYANRFHDIKILKGNLSELPFPKISIEQDRQFSTLVDHALQGDANAQIEIDDLISSLYKLDPDEKSLIFRK